jgi:hypothetical protein
VQVFIADPHISNMHLVIEAADAEQGHQTAWLLDKSTNGSFHNGVRIGNGNKILAKSGDVVSLVVVPSLEANGSYSVPDPNLVGVYVSTAMFSVHGEWAPARFP